MRIHVLGSGTSTGVPVLGCPCDVCRGGHPLNQRTRASLLIEDAGKRILFDTSPEMRLQLLKSGIDRIDAVVYTHLHSDHSAGFDDLRALSFRTREPIDLYLLPEYIEELKSRFRYAFEDTGYQGLTPMVRVHPIPEGAFSVAGLTLDPVRLNHGHVTTCGFRYRNFLYATDFKHFPQDVIARWQGQIDVMVASGIHFGTHKAHSVISETLQLFDDLKVKKGVISHLAHDVDYARDARLLPAFAEFAYDGMAIDLGPTVT